MVSFIEKENKVEQNSKYYIDSENVNLHAVHSILFIRNQFISNLILESLKFKKLLEGKS